MNFDRDFTDVQLGRDLFGDKPIEDQLHHVFLALSKRVEQAPHIIEQSLLGEPFCIR